MGVDEKNNAKDTRDQGSGQKTAEVDTHLRRSVLKELRSPRAVALQTSLFNVIPANDALNMFSNSFALWTMIPKYVWYGAKTKDLDESSYGPYEFVYMGQTYDVEIAAAKIKQLNKETGTQQFIYKYPAETEELVEQALFRIATEDGIEFTDGNYGVLFSVYRIRKILKESGHTRSFDQIREALEVLCGTQIKLWNAEGVLLEQGTCLHGLIMQKGSQKQSKAFVKFNSLVSRAILSQNFRAYDFALAMKLKKHARFLYIRIVTTYRQWSRSKPYPVTLSSFFRDRGIKDTGRKSRNYDMMKAILEDLILNGAIEPSYREEENGKDYRFLLAPTDSSIKVMKRTNYHQNQVRALAEDDNLKDYQLPLLAADQSEEEG